MWITLNAKLEDKVLSIYTIVFGNYIIKVRKIRIFYSYIGLSKRAIRDDDFEC